MPQWHYADRNRQQHGPVESAALAQLFREGRLDLHSLVWRDGLAVWQPLGDFAGELGLLDGASSGLSLEPMEPVSPDGSDPAEFGHTVYESREPAAASSPYAAPAATLTHRDRMAYAGGHVVYAGFWKRYAASFIDGIISVAVVMVSAIATMGVAGGMGAFSGAANPGAGAVSSILLGFYAIPILFQAVYFTWMQASTRQATLGKMAVGIKVARSDGQAMTTGRSLGRWAAYFFIHLASCGLGTLVSAIMVGVSERKQGLHDLACDTLVVDKWAFTAHPERQNDELGSVTILMIGLSILCMVGYFALIVFSATMRGH